MERDTLAGWMVGNHAGLVDVLPGDIDLWLEAANDEGVLALVHRALEGAEDVPVELREAFAAAARDAAAAGLLRTNECGRIHDILADAGIRVLLLKGLALGAWLYPAPYLRESSDIDLLFANLAEAERAAQRLSVLGYAMCYRPGELAQEFLCRRKAGATTIDLDMHWRISAMPLFHGAFTFAELHEASIPLPALGPHARGFKPVHAFVHACIHRASNICAGIGDRLKWLYDLHLLALRFDGDDWAELVQLCRARGLCGVCAEGIDAAAGAFGAVVPADVTAALAAGRGGEALDATRLSDWRYMQRINVMTLPTFALRVRWVWQQLFPDTDYLRELYGHDASAAGLWWERLRRGVGRVG